MTLSLRRLTIIGFVLALVQNCWAGGSGLNTLVVVNQNSSNSCEVGNYYCERRQVPPENLLRIAWAGGNLAWTNGDFQTNLLNPLLAALSARQLTNQIDYVVLSMDIPYRTINGSLPNGTTTALFYGLKTESGPAWLGITNSYTWFPLALWGIDDEVAAIVQYQDRLQAPKVTDKKALAALHVAHADDSGDAVGFPLQSESLAKLGFPDAAHWANDALTLDRRGLALIHAQEPSEIVLSEPAPRPALRQKLGRTLLAARRAVGRGFARSFGPESLDRARDRGWHHGL